MKIYCINLKRSTVRREKMKSELAKLSFDHEFVDAVDGRALSDAEIGKVYSKWRTRFRFGHAISRGEIGCALSHLKFYEGVQDSPASIVLEDDVEILDDFTKAVNAAEGFILKCNGPALIQFPGLERDAVKSSNAHFVRVDRAIGTYAYMINADAARLLRKEYTPIMMPIDQYGYLVRHCGLQLYKFSRQVVRAEVAGGTDVGDDRFNFKPSGVRLIVYKFWRVLGLAIDMFLRGVGH